MSMEGNGLLSVLGHGRNGKVNGDVTPRAFLNGRCHRADVPLGIEATSSVATIRGLEPSSSGLSGHASTYQHQQGANANANVKPRANRELVPFEADSELWPYPSTQGAGVAGGQQAEEQHDSGEDEDADIVELDFEDTSVLSDLDAFKRAAREQRGLALRKDARSGGREEQSSHRAVVAATSPRSGLGEGSSPQEKEKGKGKGKKKTRKEREARERDAIEKSWDVPDFCAGYVPGTVQQDRQGVAQQQQQVKTTPPTTTTRYLTQAVTSPPASLSPPLSPSLPDKTPQMPVHTPQISVHTPPPPRSVHTPQMPVDTPPRSVHTPQMRVHTPPRSVHTPLGPAHTPSPRRIPSSDMMTPTMSGKANGAGGKGRKLAPMNGLAAKVNGHVERNGHVVAVEGNGNGHVDASLVRGSIVAAMNAQPRVAPGMERNEFVREVLTLIHVRIFFFRFFFCEG